MNEVAQFGLDLGVEAIVGIAILFTAAAAQIIRLTVKTAVLDRLFQAEHDENEQSHERISSSVNDVMQELRLFRVESSEQHAALRKDFDDKHNALQAKIDKMVEDSRADRRKLHEKIDANNIKIAQLEVRR